MVKESPKGGKHLKIISNYWLGHSVLPASIGFGFSRIVSHKMKYVIFFV